MKPFVNTRAIAALKFERAQLVLELQRLDRALAILGGTEPAAPKPSHKRKRSHRRKYKHPRIARRNMSAAGKRNWAKKTPSERKALIAKMQAARWPGSFRHHAQRTAPSPSQRRITRITWTS